MSTGPNWDAFRQQAINAAQSDVITAKQQGLNLAAQLEQNRQGLEGKAQQHMLKLNNENAALKQQLVEAQALIADWQSSMEAWKDLAQALRDEIKACPNADAHKFGKDDKARAERADKREDVERVKRGLKPKYATTE